MQWHRPNAPSGRITSPFGPRGPIPGAPDASRDHLGVDLRAGTLGVPADLYAAAPGRVRRIYRTPLGAWVLELDHGDRVWTRYAHMQRTGIAVAAGDRVTGGQHIAAASNSGAPTIHLHFEVLVGGRQVDPVPYLQARGVDLTVTTTTATRPGAGGSITTPTIPGRPAPITPEDDMRDDERQALFQIRDTLGAQGGLNTKADSTVLAHSRATVDLLRALPNAVWMTPVLGRRPGGTDIEVHPAVEWLTVLAYRVSDLVSAPTGAGELDPDVFAQAVIDALPDDIAQTVLDGLAARLSGKD